MYNSVNVRRSLLDTAQCGEKISLDRNRRKVYNNILELVGNTPLVRLNKLPNEHGLLCEIYAKCEFLNPGGSIKDRTGIAMVKDAKKSGIINDTTRIVEASSGNTGIAIAMNAAVMGNKCTILTGEQNSSEKVNTMRLLGAEVIFVKGDEIEAAKQMKRENPDTVVNLNQFENMMNPISHCKNTGTEIASALDKIDMVVIGAGTGGTLTGVALKLKQQYPSCIVVAAEPEGSTLFNSAALESPFLVEGVGGTWVPEVLDISLADHIEMVSDQESFLTARELARNEGLLCGGSSGTIMCAAVKAAKKLNFGADKRIVVILPDGIRNYMTKFVSDQWMEAHLFLDPPQHTMKWWNKPITDLKLSNKYPILKNSVTCEQALDAMKYSNINIAMIIDDNGHFVGAVSKDNFRNIATNPSKLLNGMHDEFNFKDLATEHLVQNCYTLAENGKKGMPTIGLLSRILDITPFVIIGKEDHNKHKYFEPDSVVVGDDVLDYVYELDN